MLCCSSTFLATLLRAGSRNVQDGRGLQKQTGDEGFLHDFYTVYGFVAVKRNILYNIYLSDEEHYGLSVFKENEASERPTASTKINYSVHRLQQPR